MSVPRKRHNFDVTEYIYIQCVDMGLVEMEKEEGNNPNKSSGSEGAKIKDPLKIAYDTRNFEIELFWKRSNYFLVLNLGLATGAFGLGTEAPMAASGLSVFGLIVSILWVRVNLGGKFWQERWEVKLSDVEGEESELKFFTPQREDYEEEVKKNLSSKGCIDDFLNWLIMKKPSVSRSMIWLSMFFALFWVFILLYNVYFCPFNFHGYFEECAPKVEECLSAK